MGGITPGQLHHPRPINPSDVAISRQRALSHSSNDQTVTLLELSANADCHICMMENHQAMESGTVQGFDPIFPLFFVCGCGVSCWPRSRGLPPTARLANPLKTSFSFDFSFDSPTHALISDDLPWVTSNVSDGIEAFNSSLICISNLWTQ